MAVVMPFCMAWRGYLINQSGTATFNGPWIETRKCKEVLINVSIAAAASGTGMFLRVDGTEDETYVGTPPVFTPNPLMITGLTPTVVHANAAGITVAGNQVQFSVAANAVIIMIENVPSFIRLGYVLGGGTGVANMFNASIMGRCV